jgi:hypothetical protein
MRKQQVSLIDLQFLEQCIDALILRRSGTYDFTPTKKAAEAAFLECAEPAILLCWPLLWTLT